MDKDLVCPHCLSQSIRQYRDLDLGDYRIVCVSCGFEIRDESETQAKVYWKDLMKLYVIPEEH